MPKTVSPLPFPNLGLGGTLVAAFVCSFFAAQIACDLTVLILFGPHAFFSKGLRVASWKHAILSNGVALPWYGNLLIGPPTILFTVILIFGAEFALSRTRSFLSRKLPWATALALFLAGAALLAFAFWLYRAPHSFPPIHPIPLSALLGGLALLWKSVARRRLES